MAWRLSTENQSNQLMDMLLFRIRLPDVKFECIIGPIKWTHWKWLPHCKQWQPIRSLSYIKLQGTLTHVPGHLKWSLIIWLPSLLSCSLLQIPYRCPPPPLVKGCQQPVPTFTDARMVRNKQSIIPGSSHRCQFPPHSEISRLYLV